MICFDEAVAIIARVANPLPPEQVSLDEADGRVLARAVVADFASPPAPTSAMDGYAVRESDLATLPASLEMIGASYAGAGFEETLRPGTCARIFTGAPLPAGADRVVVQEEVTSEDGKAHFSAPLSPRRHIRETGCDFKAGEELLAAGLVLNPQRLVAVAAADRAFVEVVRRPRVALIACGDELVAAGEKNGRAGKIADSLSPAISALVRHWNGVVIERRLCSDNLASLEKTAAEAVARADMVVVTGGASVGEKDFAKTMFAPLGLELFFNKVAIRPGKPVWFGKVRETLIMGLPGNPTSALVTGRLFLAPLLTALAGNAPQQAWQWQSQKLAAPLGPCSERETFLRATESADGVLALRDQDSAAQKELAKATVLIRRRADTPALAAGEMVETLPF